jgi:hypothetical protein
MLTQGEEGMQAFDLTRAADDCASLVAGGACFDTLDRRVCHRQRPRLTAGRARPRSAGSPWCHSGWCHSSSCGCARSRHDHVALEPRPDPCATSFCPMLGSETCPHPAPPCLRLPCLRLPCLPWAMASRRRPRGPHEVKCSGEVLAFMPNGLSIASNLRRSPACDGMGSDWAEVRLRIFLIDFARSGQAPSVHVSDAAFSMTLDARRCRTPDGQRRARIIPARRALYAGAGCGIGSAR